MKKDKIGEVLLTFPCFLSFYQLWGVFECILSAFECVLGLVRL